MLAASKNFILKLKKQKHENKSLLFLDNVKIIKDAILNKTINPVYVLTTLDKLPFDYNGEVFKVDEKTIEQLSNTKTPQKVLCIAYLSQYVVETPKTNFLVLDTLQDPGNVGTLIRTAKACGFEYVYLLDSVRKTNDKLIRSSVGAIFDNKVFEMSKNEFEEFAKKNKLSLLMCDMNGENIFSFKSEGLVGVVVGNEGNGVCDQIAKLCEKTVKIPMMSGIESLNAGVSGSIVMYEINKNKFIGE